MCNRKALTCLFSSCSQDEKQETGAQVANVRKDVILLKGEGRKRKQERSQAEGGVSRRRVLRRTETVPLGVFLTKRV